jgi:hypothetical protein
MPGVLLCVQDGFITRSDLQQAVGGKLDIAHIFEEADINRDGKIDRSVSTWQQAAVGTGRNARSSV